MAASEWAVPVVLGLVAAGLAYAFVPEDVHLPRSSDESTGRPEGPYVLMPGAGAADHNTTLLAFDDAPGHGLGGVLTIHRGRVQDGVLLADEAGWLCGAAGGKTVGGAPDAGCPAGDGTLEAGAAFPIELAVAAPLPDTRIGPGHLTADVTFLAFTSSGHLIASNAPLPEREHYDLHGQFTSASQNTWHVGEGPPPPGASTVPLHRDLVREALTGTPAGGVQSVVLEDHAYDWALGPVWVTARVDAVGVSPAAEGPAPP